MLDNGCRPYIGLDRCHLKSKDGRVLIIVVSMDANNGMVLLAVAVCEIEKTETWIWFLEILHSYFDNRYDQITFCIDRQKGLLGAIENTWPTVKIIGHVLDIYMLTSPKIILELL